jgi:ankyrin repeat protein
MARNMDWGRITRLAMVALGLAGVAVPAHFQAAQAQAIASALAQEAPAAALADAAEMRDGTLIRGLLQEGADVDARQVDGMTALHWAVYHDDVDMTGLLVRSGANVNVENRYGVPPLSTASTNGNATIVGLLLDAGADPDETLEGGETILMIAARTGSLEVVELLLAKDADPNAVERRDQTALMWAAAEGHTPVVETLIDAGADVQAKLRSGFTPMFFAVREGHIEVALTLLEAGVDVNEVLRLQRERGTSPLLMAVRNGHFELAVALIDAGADPNDQLTGFAPLHTMSWVRKPDASDLGNPAPIGSGNLTSLEFVRAIVALGADVNLRLEQRAPRQPNSASRLGSGGATPFLLAADRADAALMRLFLELGADPFMPNLKGTTPMMAAAGLGTTAPEEEAGTELEVLEVTRLMIELGADVNTVNDENDTAMHGAAYGMFPAVINLLADNGADPHIWKRENHRGWTPLFIAEGYRFGLPRPSRPTIEAITPLMVAAGIPTEGPRPPVIDIYARPQGR